MRDRIIRPLHTINFTEHQIHLLAHSVLGIGINDLYVEPAEDVEIYFNSDPDMCAFWLGSNSTDLSMREGEAESVLTVKSWSLMLYYAENIAKNLNIQIYIYCGFWIDVNDVEHLNRLYSAINAQDGCKALYTEEIIAA